MNRLHVFIGAATWAALLFNACQNEPRPAPAAADIHPQADTIRPKPLSSAEARLFMITSGQVFWKGKKAAGETHSGTIAVSGGELLVNQGQLLSGRITLDMTSIAVTDIKDPGERAELVAHLRDSEFFDVKNHPTAEFRFEEALPNKTPNFNAVITGQLIMKGKTNPVNIPVRLTINGDELSAESPAFLINRTQWGINFRSGVLGTAKDKLIEDIVPLSLKIKARAQPESH